MGKNLLVPVYTNVLACTKAQNLDSRLPSCLDDDDAQHIHIHMFLSEFTHRKYLWQ